MEGDRPPRGPNMEVPVEHLNASPDTAAQLAVAVTLVIGSLLIGGAVLAIWFGWSSVRRGAAAVGAAVIVTGVVLGVTGTTSIATAMSDSPARSIGITSITRVATQP